MEENKGGNRRKRRKQREEFGIQSHVARFTGCGWVRIHTTPLIKEGK
jgi:hypothetical protein